MKASASIETQRGFSLIELMISIALGLLLISLVVPVFVSNVQTFNFSTGVSRSQESARAALTELSRNIRMVGYTGCNSREIPIVNSTGIELFNLSPSLRGHERSGTEAVPELQGANVTLTPAADAITLKTLVDVKAVVTAPVPIAAQQVEVRSGHSVVAGDTIYIGDCEAGTVVKVAQASAERLTLATPLMGARRYAAGVDLHKVEVVTYFLAESQLHTNNQSTAPSSLWRRVNTDEPQELVVGVQSLQFLYGFDTSGDGAANLFATASALGNPDHRVIIVRFQAVTNSVDSVGGEGVISKPFAISVSVRNNVSS